MDTVQQSEGACLCIPTCSDSFSTPCPASASTHKKQTVTHKEETNQSFEGLEGKGCEGVVLGVCGEVECSGRSSVLRTAAAMESCWMRKGGGGEVKASTSLRKFSMSTRSDIPIPRLFFLTTRDVCAADGRPHRRCHRRLRSVAFVYACSNYKRCRRSCVTRESF